MSIRPPPHSTPVTLCFRCLALASSSAVLAFILYIFLQAHHATSVAASNQRAYEIVAAKKQAERALMMAERQKQVLLREQQAADAARAHIEFVRASIDDLALQDERRTIALRRSS